MAFIHKGCGGEINVVKRKCKLCGKVWTGGKSLLVPPDDWMLMLQGEARKPTSYARWADKVPYAGTVAGMLPNWPRWLRILTFIIYIISIPLVIILFIKGC